ncbi:MAG TPA: zinc-ribbon and DUF3426 domain-containing protein [Usitatibacter sp.]|nr:zinc-ribbon and DUF3426 domain-containing protein [Usitatibacter sp.]
MLITTCTNCLARFRVTPQQLNARQGQVRCGRCGKVFSGFEALERVPDDDTGSRLLAAREALDRAAPAPAPGEPPELEALDAPAPIIKPAPEAPAPPPAAPAPRAERNRPVEQAAPAIAEPLELTPPPTRVSRGWSFGVVLMLLVLCMEAAYAYRAPLAMRYPALRPWLEAACSQAGCVVPWSRDERRLKLEDSELLEVPGRPDEIALAARIRNLADVAQEYPHLELTLTDIGGQPAARRVLRPADYLGHAPARDEVLAAGGEVAIQLRLATSGLKATGYQLLVFYP